MDRSSQTIGDIFEEIESQHRQTVDAIWQRERDFALRLKGRLYWPVRGNAVTGFGLRQESDTRLLTKSNGLDIAARVGVFAAATGKCYISVGRANWSDSWFDHGGSIYSLYSLESSVR
jgi:murein DD-endopeptidase MepM/ murein hydrolase activator NlpD